MFLGAKNVSITNKIMMRNVKGSGGTMLKNTRLLYVSNPFPFTQIRLRLRLKIKFDE